MIFPPVIEFTFTWIDIIDRNTLKLNFQQTDFYSTWQFHFKILIPLILLSIYPVAGNNPKESTFLGHRSETFSKGDIPEAEVRAQHRLKVWISGWKRREPRQSGSFLKGASSSSRRVQLHGQRLLLCFTAVARCLMSLSLFLLPSSILVPSFSWSRCGSRSYTVQLPLAASVAIPPLPPSAPQLSIPLISRDPRCDYAPPKI